MSFRASFCFGCAALAALSLNLACSTQSSRPSAPPAEPAPAAAPAPSPAPGPAPAEVVKQLTRALGVAPDHGGLWLDLAAAEARAGNAAEALRWIDKAVSSGLDFDLPEEPFTALRAMPELQRLLARAQENRQVVARSRVAFRIPERDLIPEGIAHDPRSGAFFVGSLNKDKIVQVDRDGRVSDFVPSGRDGLWDVLGMKVDPAGGSLWACSAAGTGGADRQSASALFRFDLATGALRGKHLLPGDVPHLCNDVVLGPAGAAYVTDSNAGAVYRLRPGGEALEPLAAPGTFIYPNGIAITADGAWLIVADFSKGLSRVEVATGAVHRLSRPDRVQVAGLDGIYLDGSSLIAVQNSAGTERIVRFRLSPGLDAVESVEVLESRNPLFRIPTTGVIAGKSLVYLANSLLDRLDDRGRLRPDAQLEEVVVLELPLD